MESDLTDLLPRLRAESDIGWALARKAFPRLDDANKSLSRRQLMEEILSSQRVRDVLTPALELEARAILDEMLADFGLGSVRGVGFVVHKAFQRMFSGIWTNVGEVERLKELTRSDRLVFLPSHLSYMDFLLLTYVCYTLGLQPPVIAAGMDFKGMKGVGEALRRCGAFFIRRSFGTDREVYDVALVPVSISFSRILEERLYAYELLGRPKPAESTSALLKARTVLGTDLGHVVLRFCSPISARHFFRGRFRPRIHNPGDWELSEEEKGGARALADAVLATHQRHRIVCGLCDPSFCAVSAWTLLCLALSTSNERRWSVLLSQVASLRRSCESMGTAVHLRHAASLQEELEYFLRLHGNLVERSGDQLHLLPMDTAPSTAQPQLGALSPTAAAAALTPLAIGAYAAGCLHVLRDAAFLATAQRLKNKGRERMLQEFTWLRGRLFARELPTQSERLGEEFEEAMSGLGAVKDPMATAWLQTLLAAYQIVLRVMLASGDRLSSPDHLLSTAQTTAAGLMESGLLPGAWSGWLLSAAVIRNAIATFQDLGALRIGPGKMRSDALSSAVLLERTNRLLQPNIRRALADAPVSLFLPAMKAKL